MHFLGDHRGEGDFQKVLGFCIVAYGPIKYIKIPHSKNSMNRGGYFKMFSMGYETLYIPSDPT
jgi:hypothetical protein